MINLSNKPVVRRLFTSNIYSFIWISETLWGCCPTPPTSFFSTIAVLTGGIQGSYCRSMIGPTCGQHLSDPWVHTVCSASPSRDGCEFFAQYTDTEPSISSQNILDIQRTLRPCVQGFSYHKTQPQIWFCERWYSQSSVTTRLTEIVWIVLKSTMSIVWNFISVSSW